MTMSTALSAGQAKDYYQAEYTSTQESYYTEDENVKGEWFGKQAEQWGLEGEVDQESFERLCEGQDPRTGLQLVRHVPAKEYENAYGEMVETSEHRAGWDATFSAPKSVSLAALVGGDERITEAHDRSVNAALAELEKYVQARIGGNNPAETTGRMVAAKFEHDAARPDRATGYAAPQLHTHVVISNLTQTETGRIKPIQPIELYRSQQYATAIYRTVLATELQELGYEVTVDARTGAPEINGFSKEYLAASSPRHQEIEHDQRKRHCGVQASPSFQKLSVSATSGDGIPGISNPALQGSDPGTAQEQSTADDHLEQARQRLDKVSAESMAANEAGMGAGLAAETEAASPETLAALL